MTNNANKDAVLATLIAFMVAINEWTFRDVFEGWDYVDPISLGAWSLGEAGLVTIYGDSMTGMMLTRSVNKITHFEVMGAVGANPIDSPYDLGVLLSASEKKFGTNCRALIEGWIGSRTSLHKLVLDYRLARRIREARIRSRRSL